MIKFYGQLGIDKVIYERYFQNKKNGFFVECGALDGVWSSSCLFFERHLGWSGVNIEAYPPHFEKLKLNRPMAENINCALSNRDGTASFKHVIRNGQDIGNGSLNHTGGHMNRLLSNIDGVHTFVDVTVDVKTYSSVMRSLFGKIPSVDLFVLDVEGEELKVLEDFHNLSNTEKPLIMCIEYGHIGLHILSELMDTLGYMYDYKDDINAIYKRE
jgi:FkbM family methyltransferase